MHTLKSETYGTYAIIYDNILTTHDIDNRINVSIHNVDINRSCLHRWVK